MNKRRTRTILKDSVVRGMTRNEYYAASHYIRSFGRLVESKINWPLFDQKFLDLALYGQSEIKYEDMIL